jgi:tetratricopeptide (TPR) repeat protein
MRSVALATSLWAVTTSLAAWGLAASGCGGGPSEDELHRSQAQYDLGVGLMQEENVAGAFQHLQEAVRLDPDNADAHLLLGNLYLFRGDHPQSERHLREALRANGELGAAGRPALNAEANNSLGVLYLNWQRYQDAVTALRESTGDLMNRTPHLAWGNLGWAYYELGDLREAEQSLQQAIQSQPRFCAAWYRLGQVHLARGEQAEGAAAGGGEPHFRHAEEAFTHALEVPDDACQRLQEAWRLRGQTRVRLGRREEAVSDLERCVELERETAAGRACGGLLADGGLAERGDGQEEAP